MYRDGNNAIITVYYSMRYINKTKIRSCIAPVRGVNWIVASGLLADQQLTSSCIKILIPSLNTILMVYIHLSSYSSNTAHLSHQVAPLHCANITPCRTLYGSTICVDCRTLLSKGA